MDNPYLEVISYVERLHRQFLEVVKLELEGLRIHDINNVQAMMLFNIGDAEMTVGELTLRGCYLGSNVSYNVRKMVENEYLAHERSVHDRRSIHVRLTEKGIKLRDRLTAMHRRHAEMLSQAAVSADDLQAAGVMLRRLERFWIAPPTWCSDRRRWHRLLRPRLSLFSPDARSPTRWFMGKGWSSFPSATIGSKQGRWAAMGRAQVC